MPLWERLECHVRETKVALSVYEALETLRGLGNKELFEYATADMGFDVDRDMPAATNALMILSRCVWVRKAFCACVCVRACVRTCVCVCVSC
jgi:hypothetical protein